MFLNFLFLFLILFLGINVLLTVIIRMFFDTSTLEERYFGKSDFSFYLNFLKFLFVSPEKLSCKPHIGKKHALFLKRSLTSARKGAFLFSIVIIVVFFFVIPRLIELAS